MARAANMATSSGPLSPERLKSFIERIEKLEEERAAIDGDIRDVYGEAKGIGYDEDAMRLVVALRRMEAAHRRNATRCSKPIGMAKACSSCTGKPSGTP
jgi:uncharacterized protein (UPF0335 family)